MAVNNGFTPQAQEALRLAHTIVQQKRHNQLDVEHIMLALLKPQDGVVCRIIAMAGGDSGLLANQIDDALNASPRLYSGYGGMGTTNMHISMRAQRVVSEAAMAAGQMDDEYIGVEHLFLAITGERGGSVARVLTGMGIDKEHIYQALREIRSVGSNEPTITVEVLDKNDPYQRILRRVIRLQDELAALRRDLEMVIQQTTGPGGGAATAPGDGEQQQSS